MSLPPISTFRTNFLKSIPSRKDDKNNDNVNKYEEKGGRSVVGAPPRVARSKSNYFESRYIEKKEVQEIVATHSKKNIAEITRRTSKTKDVNIHYSIKREHIKAFLNRISNQLKNVGMNNETIDCTIEIIESSRESQDLIKTKKIISQKFPSLDRAEQNSIIKAIDRIGSNVIPGKNMIMAYLRSNLRTTTC